MYTFSFYSRILGVTNASPDRSVQPPRQLVIALCRYYRWSSVPLERFGASHVMWSLATSRWTMFCWTTRPVQCTSNRRSICRALYITGPMSHRCAKKSSILFSWALLVLYFGLVLNICRYFGLVLNLVFISYVVQQTSKFLSQMDRVHFPYIYLYWNG